jgi:hypothetical protein
MTRNDNGKGKGKVHSRTDHESPEFGAEVSLYTFFNLLAPEFSI